MPTGSFASRWTALAAFALGTALIASEALGECSWSPEFNSRGLDNDAFASTVFDDGSGPALYVGGNFTTAGEIPANNIAKWNGSTWLPLGSGTSGAVYALAVFDDGTGPALYAAGTFSEAGDQAVSHIAKWDGSSWSSLGGGTSNWIFALAVWNDGSGPALYAAGVFNSAGGTSASKIAKWNGSTWSAVGSGVNGTVHALTVFDDGGGSALYLAGLFQTLGPVTVNSVAKWNGSAFSALGSSSSRSVYSLAVFDDGGGPALYAGGQFSSLGGITAQNIAKWNGADWSALGAGVTAAIPAVYAMTPFNDGSATALYVGGRFTSAGGAGAQNIAKWDGSTWSAGAPGTNDVINTLTVYNQGGSALFAGGGFTSAGTTNASFIARWNGAVWTPLSTGAGQGMNSQVASLAVFDDGSGPALYAGGQFRTAGDVVGNGIAKWNGSSWEAVGGGANDPVWTLTAAGPGSPALFAGGTFTTIGGVSAGYIAKWDGMAWSALGDGLDSPPRASGYFDLGSGSALYVGGTFENAGGISAHRIAKWDGAAWSALGSGLNHWVDSLEVFSDGGGPALFAGGDFTDVGGGGGDHIAKWNGSTWSAPGGGVNGKVWALKAFDGALYAGGDFTVAGGVSANHIAKWNGSAWSALGSLADPVFALAVFDDGGGPRLYAATSPPWSPGRAPGRGSLSSATVSKWDGSVWIPLGKGMNMGWIWALEIFDSGTGPKLYAGGDFTVVDGRVSNRIAEYSCTAAITAGDCNSSSTLTSDDLSAVAIEIFDNDGDFWLDAPNGKFPGNPTGCDANGDTLIRAGDVSCSGLLIAGGACGLRDNRPAGIAGIPALEVSTSFDTGMVWIRGALRSNGKAVGSVVFSLDLSPAQFDFTQIDTNGNGEPDHLRFPAGQPELAFVRWQPDDPDGELDLVLAKLGGALADGALIEIGVPANQPPAGGLELSTDPSLSFGATNGLDLEGDGIDPTRIFADGFESGNTGEWHTTLP